jgi:hypothetical protein
LGKNDIVKIQDRLRQKISRCIRICKDLKNVETIFEPSKGGKGIKLKAAKTILMSTEYSLIFISSFLINILTPL